MLGFLIQYNTIQLQLSNSSALNVKPNNEIFDFQSTGLYYRDNLTIFNLVTHG